MYKTHIRDGYHANKVDVTMQTVDMVMGQACRAKWSPYHCECVEE